MASHSFTVTHSSAYPNWRTEKTLVTALDDEFEFILDAAATSKNRIAAGYFGPDHRCETQRDALAVKDWTRHGGTDSHPGRRPIFCNPPSSKEDGITLGPWLEKFAEQARDFGATIVAVVPYKPSEQWWRHTRSAVEVREIPFRVRYWIPDDELALVNAARLEAGKRPITSGDTAGFSTAVVIWRPQLGIIQPATPRVVTWEYPRALKAPRSARTRP
jgi:phage N-6-adenine-methyltransferase